MGVEIIRIKAVLSSTGLELELSLAIYLRCGSCHVQIKQVVFHLPLHQVHGLEVAGGTSSKYMTSPSKKREVNSGSELLYTPSFGSAPSRAHSNQEIYHKTSHSSFRTQQTRKKIITPMGTGYKAQ